MAEVILALGTNLGDRRGNLENAVARLAQTMVVAERSGIYETAPMYVTDQPAFLNMAVRGETVMDPEPLLVALKQIEDDLGRIESFRNGPRLIDIDILYFDDTVLNVPNLTLPHPRIAERAFVLMPLADLCPDFRDPGTGRTVRAMLDAVPGKDGVVRLPAEARPT